MSLTSLEQVFIKLAKEKELVLVEAPSTSILGRLRNATGRIVRMISPGSLYLQESSLESDHSTRKGSDQCNVPSICNNNRKFDDGLPGLLATRNGIPPSMSAITALSDQTDMESRRSGDESSSCPGQLPDKSEDAESTQDSTLSAVNLPGSEIRKEKNSNFSMGDNVATSDPGSSNSWSVDISLHSAESRPITPRYTPMSAHLKELDREESQDNDNLKLFETDVEEKEDLEVLS